MNASSRVDLVVFDMAGTTVYDGDLVHRSLIAALAEHGVDVTRDAVNAVMGIAKPIAILELIAGRVPPADLKETADRSYRRFVEIMLGAYRDDPQVRAVDGAEEVFMQLRASGVSVALDTGFSRRIADAVLDRLGWMRGDLIDVTVASDEVAHGRPAPDMVFRVMRAVQINDPARVAKVGDTPADLQEGLAAGCRWVIGVTNGSHTAEELQAFSHTHLIESVRDLPQILL